jgi:two-component system sensor histidine kinase PilS (NtrC family)
MRDERDQALLLGPGLNHEMRHPLMGIKAGMELLARGDPRLAATDDFRLVSTQVARLEELFRTYQSLFRAEQIPRDRFALGPVVQRAVQLMVHRLRQLGPRFSCLFEERLEHACGEPNALLHALVNLLANALDAVEQRGAPARIQVRGLRASGFVELRVSDDGSGIAPQDRERVFQPGFTTHPEGTGLGLYVAREAMRRAGGDVLLVAESDARRAPWARTEFSVVVPEVC